MDMGTRTESTAPHAIELPSLSLPKGGGATQGLGETLSAGGVSGAASLSLPLPITDAGRTTPALALGYSSGGGNSPFGLGVELNVPSIGRRTAKGVPRYTNADEFIDVSGEVLVRVGETTEQTLNGRRFQVTPFAPRVEGNFDQIEYWHTDDEGEVPSAFWRVRAADGTQHLFGYTAAARLADPAAPARIARWWLEESVTPHGEHVYYAYKAEDASGVEVDAPFEQPRERRAQRYLKHVCYGNRQACTDLYLMNGAQVPADWHFELVFDYGEHAAGPEVLPSYAPTRAWLARADPFSDYAAGFEVRTHRLCRQVLMFHRFDALGADPVLVRRLYLEYDEQLVLSRLRAAWVTGYGPDPASGQLAAASLPPIELDFGAFALDQRTFEPFEPLSGLNDGTLYQLVDLYGEGLPGVLYRDGTSYWYRAPVRATQGEDAIAYDAWRPLPQLPVGGLGPSSRSSLMDLTGDGQLDWVIAQPGFAGFFSLGPDKQWQAFVPFSAFPPEFLHPHAQLVALMGAGLPDLALIGPKSVRLYANRREAGFARPEEVAHAPDSLPGGLSTRIELVAFSDVLGSGQPHLVRVCHNALVCWPNLGRGRFGAPITLATLPFEPHTFDPARVRLADLDGSGAADLIYLENSRFRVCRNQGGNGFALPVDLPWPDGVHYDDTCQVSFADVHGTGCAALVLTVPHPTPRHWIVDFTSGKKPYLLERVNNNRGLNMQLVYRSSAQAWLDEKHATPTAVSHLPFPVQIVSQVTQTDEITSNTLTQCYQYQHGFYDGHEREFRGFGLVTHRDTEANKKTDQDEGTASANDDTLTAPAITKTWYRVGATQDDGYRTEYYAGDAQAQPLGKTRWLDDKDQPIAQPDAELLHAMRRALRGRVMREEVYGVDSIPAAAHPYTVTEYRYQVRIVQNQPGARVLLPMQLEQRSWQYERSPLDPLSVHQVLLKADRYGFPVWSASVRYPRRENPGTPAEYNDEQQFKLWVAETCSTLVHLDQDAGKRRLGLPCETKTAVISNAGAPPSGLLGYEQLSDGRLDPTKPRELTGWHRHYYTDIAHQEGAALPLGQATVEGLLHHTCQAEVTDAVLKQACEGLPSPGELDQWMIQAKYEKTDGYYWVKSASAYYRKLADFYRLSHQIDAFGARTELEYDASRCCVTKVTDAMGNVTQAQYDYRLLQPQCIIDANENKQEALYDPLGRPRVSSFYGKENNQPVGFKPVKDYRTTIQTVQAALANPVGAIQQAAVVYYDDLSSWMGRLTDDTLSADERDKLQKAGLMMANGEVRVRYRWLSHAPQSISPDRWQQIKAAMASAARTPVRSTVFAHDGYPADAQHQIRCAVTFTDGFGRALQTKQRVANGPAWVANPDGTLKLGANQQPVTENTASRWVVSGRVEYNNKGLAVRQYRPYFIDTAGYVNDVSLRQFGYYDTYYYDPLGRNTRVKTAAGYERRAQFDVWFDTHEDENDTRAQPGDVCDETPTVNVRDNRGLSVREVQYNRAVKGEARQTLITRHAFDAKGARVSSSDARRFGPSPVKTPNFKYVRTLSDRVLRTDSADAGTRVELSDARGLSTWSASGNQHQQRWTYDALGRPTARFERLADKPEACCERFVYSDANRQPGQNLSGRLVRHLDPAGSTEVSGYTLGGQPLDEKRGLLKTLDEPDWPTEPAAQNDLLETTRYTTRWTYNALGESVTQTDAMGNVQQTEYDAAGQLSSVKLKQKQEPHAGALLKSIQYSAHGQIESETAGNGVTTAYTYDPKTLRLTQSLAKDKDGKVRQHLVYAYDPAGNILSIEDRAIAPVFFKNEQVEAKAVYTYDALYQLISATGREQADAKPGRQLPNRIDLPALNQRVNYTHTYTYDQGGNLIGIQGARGSRFKQTMTIAGDSNRLTQLSGSPQSDDNTENIQYDVNGNPQSLGAKVMKTLAWDGCNQLKHAVMLERQDGQSNDEEQYRYDGHRQRVRKTTRTLAAGGMLQDEVIYLPGLEVRRHYDVKNQLTEELHLIAAHAGRAQIRVLHWEKGQPEKIENNQIRYSLDNHLGSSMMELDRDANLLTYEEYYPYGGTAVWATKSETEAKYKTIRYSGKERDATGLYYYGFRYYAPWLGRWLNPDPAGTVDGLNLFRMVRNSPVSRRDPTGLTPTQSDRDEVSSSSSDTTSPHTLQYLAKQVAGNLTKYKPEDILEFHGGIRELRGQAYAHGYVEAKNNISRAEKANATRKARGKGEAPPATLSSIADEVRKKIANYIPIEIKSKSKEANFVSISKNSNIYTGINIDTTSGGGLRMNQDRSGLIGVPYKGSTDPYHPILERDIDGNELVFRSMSKDDFGHLKDTRELKSTTETSISPAIAYSLEYAWPGNSETIQFTLEPGTSEKLQTIGLAMGKEAMSRFPAMKKSGGEWKMTNAQFKSEGKQITTQLGQGAAIDIFNRNIVDYKPIQRIFK